MEIRKIVATALPKKIVNNTTVKNNSKLYEQTTDIFVRRDSVKDVAKEFRSKIIVPFADWNGVLPTDGEGGCGPFKKINSTIYSIRRKTFKKRC